ARAGLSLSRRVRGARPCRDDRRRRGGRYGDTVRRRIADYVAKPGWCEGTVDTYYGPQGAHDFMERTTWHAAQHLREIYWFLDQVGVEAEAPLTDTDLAALPIPRDVWS